MKKILVLGLVVFIVAALGVFAQKPDSSVPGALDYLSALVIDHDARISDLEAMPQKQTSGYIKIGDIKGESTDTDHKDWINLLSVSSSINTPETSGRARGQAQFGDIVLTKEVDKSTPKLQEAIAQGKHFPEAEFELVRTSSDAGRQTYLKYELKNVLITSYELQSEPDEVPTESLSLNYEEIKVTYTEYDGAGREKGKVEYTWKVEEGEA